MQKSSKAPHRIPTVVTAEPTRYFFFLSPYEKIDFNRCPKCEAKTLMRKFYLMIHIDPQQLISLPRICRYCPRDELIIAQESELEDLLYSVYAKDLPEVIGNDYMVIGTLDRKDWRQFHSMPTDSDGALAKTHVFKNHIYVDEAL